MNNWKFGVVIGLVVVAVLVGARFLPTSNTVNNSAVKGDIISEDNIDKVALAKHLTQVGAKVYGAVDCHACVSQKEMFGNAWQYINYVECGALSGSQAKVCLVAKIGAYPTWEFSNGDKQVGVITLSELAQKSSFTK